MQNFEQQLLTRIKLSPGASQIRDALAARGYLVFLVGGAVRDIFLGRHSRDYDLLTDCPLAALQELFPRSVYFNASQRTLLVISQGEGVEVSSLAGMTLAQELKTRDFSINAMAVDFASGQLVDPLKGREALLQKRLASCQAPMDCFAADPLRLLRMLRFAADFSLVMDEELMLAGKKSAALLSRVSQERLREELNRLLLRPQGVKAGIEEWHNFGILPMVLPEVAAMEGVPQSPPHRHDCLEHTLAAVERTAPVLELRLAALLHDIGKPGTAELVDGNWRFYGHHELGAELAQAALRRLCYPEATVEQVVSLVRNHMFVYQGQGTQDKTLARLLRRIVPANLEGLVALRLADWTAIYPDGDTSIYQEMLSRGGALQKAGRDQGVSQLTVSGEDVMRLLAIPPGPRVGEILNMLLEKVDEDPSINTRESLEQIIRKAK